MAGENWGNWRLRDDLPGYVIAKGVNFTVKLIQSVGNAKRCVLAALFDKGKKEMIDEVLGRIEYDDRDLYGFTHFQNELAGSPEKFFRVLDKIKDPKNQEEAVRCGVIYLHRAERHDLIVPLVDALEKKMFKRDRLKEQAIHTAFCNGADRDKQDIVQLYYEHPAIVTEGIYHRIVLVLARWQTESSFSIFIEAG